MLLVDALAPEVFVIILLFVNDERFLECGGGGAAAATATFDG
jgi:hypothetical protein